MTATLADGARRDIERLLLEHPDVKRAAVFDEEGPASERYTTAYVVPFPERMAAAKVESYRADRDKRVGRWQAIFNQTYRFKHDDPTPSFTGWTSSYTNRPIPETEMREWLDGAVERIASLRPERAWEIGCGVGLLVQHLAPRCRFYRGTDFSPVAIRRLREFAATRPELRHVEFAEREATNFDGLAPGSVDTVILNSVIQYFPDLDYLKTVLEGATRVVASGGHVFIGDVRHLGLQPLFHGSIQFAKAPPEATAGWLRRKVGLAIAQERELVIDPRFFLTLAQSLPRVAEVDILLKLGSADNEVTRYRYDVVLRIGEAARPPFRQEVEWQAGGQPAADLVSRFVEERIPAVRILDVPNVRLARDLAAVRAIEAAGEQELIKNIRQTLEKFDSVGLDPEAFRRLCDPQVHNVRVEWSAGSQEGRFDVTLVDRRQWAEPSPLRRPELGIAAEPAKLATDPLEAAFMQQLGLDLGEMLRTHLPEPLLPAAVIVVHQMPAG